MSENTSESDDRPHFGRGTSFGDLKKVFWGSSGDRASDPQAARRLKESADAEDENKESDSSLPWELR